MRPLTEILTPRELERLATLNPEPRSNAEFVARAWLRMREAEAGRLTRRVDPRELEHVTVPAAGLLADERGVSGTVMAPRRSPGAGLTRRERAIITVAAESDAMLRKRIEDLEGVVRAMVESAARSP